jgi:Protein of unknown function (DUF1573)
MKLMFTLKRTLLSAGFLGLLSMGTLYANDALLITPSVFDFGWAPDNAKISAQFTVKNNSSDLVALTSVQPTCGCTASNFTPADLPSDKETKIGLTFDTHGYAGISFNKSTKVKAGNPEMDYTVKLAGFVHDPMAKIVPVGDGIASYDSETKDDKKTIEIQNKLDKEVTVSIVQEPASWAKASLRSTVIAAGKTVPLDVVVKGSYEESKNTSVTLQATDGTATHRLTIAIRTGASPQGYRKIRAPEPSKATTPAPAKKSTTKKKTTSKQNPK